MTRRARPKGKGWKREVEQVEQVDTVAVSGHVKHTHVSTSWKKTKGKKRRRI